MFHHQGRPVIWYKDTPTQVINDLPHCKMMLLSRLGNKIDHYALPGLGVSIVVGHSIDKAIRTKIYRNKFGRS